MLKTLSSQTNQADLEQNYDYQLAWANIYNQRHDMSHALTSFARANLLAAEDPTAERGMLQVAGQEGMEIYPNLTIQNDFSSSALFDDATLFQMDNEFFSTPIRPRFNQETDLTTDFHYNSEHFAPINGVIGVRNYKGSISLPSQLAIVRRDTFDTIFNVGTSPVLRLGNARFVLTPGLQFTDRRDSESPIGMNQHLFRQYLYLNTSPLFQWITIHGSAVHESGPFTNQNLSSRDLGANLEFQVGRPWGSNSFLTGYSVRDLLFHPAVREFFTTDTWAGLQHKFGQKASITGLANYIRSWRVQDQAFATAQILVPGARFELKPNDRWTFNATADFTRGEGFHLYDNVQSGFLISYVRPVRRSMNDTTGPLPVDYPLRFSVGLQQQSFYNFTGNVRTSAFRPVFQISIF